MTFSNTYHTYLGITESSLLVLSCTAKWLILKLNLESENIVYIKINKTTQTFLKSNFRGKLYTIHRVYYKHIFRNIAILGFDMKM